MWKPAIAKCRSNVIATRQRAASMNHVSISSWEHRPLEPEPFAPPVRARPPPADRIPAWATWVPVYGMGSLADYWWLERALALLRW